MFGEKINLKRVLEKQKKILKQEIKILRKLKEEPTRNFQKLKKITQKMSKESF